MEVERAEFEENHKKETKILNKSIAEFKSRLEFQVSCDVNCETIISNCVGDELIMVICKKNSGKLDKNLP